MTKRLDHDDIFIFSLTLSVFLFSLQKRKRNKRNPSVRSTLFLSLVSVVLLDTTQEEKLEWTKYPFGAEANTPGVSFAIVAILSRDLITRSPPRLNSFSIETVDPLSAPGKIGGGGDGKKKLDDFSRRKQKRYAVGSFRGDKMDTARRQEERGLGGGRGIRSTLWSRCARHTWAPAGRCALSGAMFVFQLLSAQRAARQV